MAHTNHCPQCGADLPTDAPEGLCPKCLMKAVQSPTLRPGGDEAQADVGATIGGSASIEGPGTRIGRYELLELIGEGGMGLVYLAEQKEPVKRRVALKIIKPGMDSKQVVARFEAERQVLALLDHPNIAHVLDAGTTGAGRPYFVMEYVKGLSITQYCDQNKVNIEQRLKLFRQVCEGVHHAHQKGIIHRDLKPSNILVSVHEDRVVPKIIDFGIAKATTQPLTDKTVFTYQGQLLGTPEYMSPEQVDLATQDIDIRSDIYSLGVVLYELLAGVLPFEREALARLGFAEVQRTIREQEPASPSIRLTNLGEQANTIAASRGTQAVPLARRLHRELEWIPLKAMRKDRCRRYRSAAELADDVQNYLDGHPLTAGPETAIYRVRKFVHRHAGSVATAALIALTIILGLVVSTAMYLRAEDARQKEAAARAQAEQAREKETVARTQAEQAEQATKQKAEELRRTLYVNSIQLADAKYREGNIRRMRELLTACPEDLRGWEWHRLNYISDQSIMTLRGHESRVDSTAVSPDGKRIVSGSADNTIKIWDAVRGAELLTIQRVDGNDVTCVAVSPDDRRIASGDDSGQIKVWDAASGKEMLAIKGHKYPTSIVFSPDGTRILCGSVDGTASVRDALTGTEIMTLRGHESRVSSVAFSPDGKRIVSVGLLFSNIKVFDAMNGNDLITIKGPRGYAYAVVFSPDGKSIVAGAHDEIKMWDSTSGAEQMTLPAHEGVVRSVAFSPDGKRVVSGGEDNTIKVWDVAARMNTLTLRGHENFVTCVAFTPDGKQIVSRSMDGTIRIWDATVNRHEQTSLAGHHDLVCSVAFNPNRDRLVSCSWDKTFKVWDIETGTEVITCSRRAHAFYSVSFSPDGKRIVSAGTDDTAKIWDAETVAEILTLRGHEDAVRCAVFSPDGKLIVSGSTDRTVRLWDAQTGVEKATLRGHDALVVDVAFSPDGNRIVSAGEDGAIKIWDVATGTQIMNLSGHKLCVQGIAFSADSKRIASGSDDRTAKIWDATTGEELMTLRGHREIVVSVAFSPDGRRIVTSSRDGTTKLWDSTTGIELLSLRSYPWACAVAFCPDGKTIAAGTMGNTVMVWESAAPSSGYEARRNGAAATKLVDDLYQQHESYYEVINRLNADNTLDDSLRKIALQIANSRKWEDADKLMN